MAVVRGEELAPLVDLQRLPWVEHRRGGEIAHRRRIAIVGDVDDGYAQVRAVEGAECRAVIGTDRAVLVSVPFPVANAAGPLSVLELGRLPVRTVAPAL